MAWDYVSVERRKDIAVVRFDRRGSRNAFNQKLIRELTEAADTFRDDLATHCIVLAGAPEAFSAGADLKDLESWDLGEQTDLERRQRFYAGVRLCKAWEELPQIAIAAMEGMAVGAGAAIALACDWRVLARSAFIYVPEVKIGMNLQWGTLPRLITLVGPARAKRITLMCERMGAQQALDWGLIDEIAEDGGTVEKALAMAETVATMPPVTVRLMKEAINATAGALHRATSFADADQSQLAGSFSASIDARQSFRKRG